jgi:hypothetical protein
MTDTTTTVDGYLAAWNERDETARNDLVARFWAEDATLTDPPMSGEGHAGISGLAATLHQQFPDHRFVRTSGVDEHHGVLRFGWDLVGPDGAPALSGIDVGLIGGDGRMTRVVGFFGDLPEREAA